MDVIKTYIPKRYRSKKLVNSGGSSGSTTVINSGSSDFSPSAFVDSDTFYSMFEYDAINDAIKAKKEFYSVAGITAYGTGTVGGGGGTGVAVYNGLDSTDISLALSAAMGKQLNDTKLNSSAISAWALASVKPAYTISEITGLGTALAGKSDTTHRHTISEITDFAHVHQWSAIENKPSVFTPDVHDHYKADILDFPASMPASDVAAWAKAAIKPSYTASEIGLGNVLNVASWSKTESDSRYAQVSNLSNYLPLTGGVLTGALQVNANAIFRKQTAQTSPTLQPISSEGIAGGTLATSAAIGFHNPGLNWGSIVLHDSAFKLMNSDMTGYMSLIASDVLVNGIASSDKSVKNFINKFNSMFDTDVNGNIVAKTNLYSVGGISAYQSGAGVSGLTLQGDMNANGKNITGASQIYAGNAYMGNVGINPSLQWSYDGDENTMVEYDLLTGEYKYAGNQVKYLNNILTVTGQVNATEFKFGNYSFKQSANGLSICFNGVEQAYITNTGQYVNS